MGVRNNIYNKNGEIIHKGWKLDYRKLYIFLKHKYRVSKAYMFLGFVEANRSLYEDLNSIGYSIIFKKTLEVRKEGKVFVKGNVDVELSIYCSAIFYGQYDKAVVISGDGDFSLLYDFLILNSKLKSIIIPNRYSYSSLLKDYQSYLDFITWYRGRLEKKKVGINPYRRTERGAHHHDA